jgi:hypothetical protein
MARSLRWFKEFQLNSGTIRCGLRATEVRIMGILVEYSVVKRC